MCVCVCVGASVCACALHVCVRRFAILLTLPTNIAVT